MRDREELQRLREILETYPNVNTKSLDDWKNEIDSAIRLAQEKRPIRRGAERDEYDRQVFRRILCYDQHEKFFALFDKHLNGFVTNIKRVYHLKNRELMFVCLSVIELNDEQIALLMDYSVGSIATTRKRIGDKMGIENISQLHEKLLYFIGQD